MVTTSATAPQVSNNAIEPVQLSSLSMQWPTSS
jgi:hypothetical protein